jgi:hypothetical protein
MRTRHVDTVAGGAWMLSDQENQQLAEIEFHLRLSDPKFVARMAKRFGGRRPWYRRWRPGR